MKNLFTILMMSLVSLGFTDCSGVKTLSNGKVIDKGLVGIWTGVESDKQMKGVRKEWEMSRKKDGSYTLEFTAITPDGSINFDENGTWWVDNGTFFEFHNESGKTDSYNYTILNRDNIQFKMIDSGAPFYDPNYTFIDTRKGTQQVAVTLEDK
ncbi:MAG: hypothetical protein ACI9YL_001279 [Luteibaculaceae bacterium]|jgi:hypothetical protein